MVIKRLWTIITRLWMFSDRLLTRNTEVAFSSKPPLAIEIVLVIGNLEAGMVGLGQIPSNECPWLVIRLGWMNGMNDMTVLRATVNGIGGPRSINEMARMNEHICSRATWQQLLNLVGPHAMTHLMSVITRQRLA